MAEYRMEDVFVMKKTSC